MHDITGREYDAILPGEFNTSRLPDYHRLDVGLTYRTKYRRYTIEPSLQIINVYNNDNVYFRFYDTTENPVRVEDVTMLPLVPTVGVRIAF